MSKRQTRFFHVAAHTGKKDWFSHHNDIADKMARAAICSLRENMSKDVSQQRSDGVSNVGSSTLKNLTTPMKYNIIKDVVSTTSDDADRNVSTTVPIISFAKKHKSILDYFNK